MDNEINSEPGGLGSDQGPGALLRVAREQRGLSLQDVADGLNLKPKVVDALEQERYEQLPPRTFVKGYYKSYAKLVGVKEYDVLAALDRQLPEPTPRPLTPNRHERDATDSTGGWFKWLLLLTAIAGLLFLFYSQFDRSRPKVPAVPQESTRVEPAPAPAIVTEEETSPPDVSAPPTAGAIEAAPVETPKEAPVAESPDSAEEASTAAAPIPDSEPSPAAAAPAIAQISVDVTGESWLEVRDGNGTKRFSGIARGPRRYEFSGTPPFSLVIGDVSQVELRFNGEPVALGALAPGKVARLSLPIR